jgi:hypothetical protein
MTEGREEREKTSGPKHPAESAKVELFADPTDRGLRRLFAKFLDS